ncbi:MAG: MOSC domain-containing protein [Ilumatobacter sp.]|nr:MOSC domain-containing protein [Ilumatobacter sp.]
MSRVTSLTTAATYGSALQSHDEVTATEGVGIVGDRHAGGVRQVTIVCTGELMLAAAELGVDTIDGAATRRNIVVDCEQLPREHGSRIVIGDVELEVWRDCAPCNLMDELFGDGARAALRQRAGVSATVVRGGTIRVGDPVKL